MSRWNKSRALEWGSANRPKVSNKLGIPFQNEGSDGDIQVRQTSLGGKLFTKLGGRWHDAPLSLSTGSSVYTVDEINLTGKINIKGSGTANVMMGRWATSNQDVGNENIVIGSDAIGHGANICVIANADVTAIHPADDGGVNLGSAAYSYDAVWAADGAFNVSDRRI